MANQIPQQPEKNAPRDNPHPQPPVFSIDPSRPSTMYPSGLEMDDRSEPFGMPFRNRQVAVIVAKELNRHNRGIWFYKVERHIDGKRWIIVRDPGDVFLRVCGERSRGGAPWARIVRSLPLAILGTGLAVSFGLVLRAVAAREGHALLLD